MTRPSLDFVMRSTGSTRAHLNVTDLLKQKTQAKTFLDAPIENHSWYVLDFQWWTRWCAFIDAATSGDSLDIACDDYPGEIDNTNLLNGDGKLKPNLLREEDITVIPEELWNMFVQYYGCVHKDPSVFKRTAVKTPSDRWVVEIYPPHFSFLELTTFKFLFEGIYSESHTIGELKTIVKQNLQLDNKMNVRLFVLDGNAIEELTNDGVTIGEASLERKKNLYVKLDISDGPNTSSVQMGVSRSNGPLSSASMLSSPSGNCLYNSGTRQKPGVCGLSNLGNTCFMNSAIQCMSNVPDLTAYFLGEWKKDINKFNPLGTHGRIATAYAELISHMWSGLYTYDVPRALKREIAVIANQFYGCAQHDSHELLVFLLDGLHEDLNRVLNKPYVEFQDAGDRDDEVVAQESWKNHKARNDSIVVDCFHGLLKSTVVCPTCHYRSVTFDPFASLNLPLPEISRYHKLVYLWPWAHSGHVGPIRYEVPVNTVFYARDLIVSLEALRPPQPGCQYYLTEVYNHSLSRPFHLDHQIRDRYGPPLFVYELPPGELIPVRFHRPSCYNTSGWVGIPFFISIPASALSTIDESYLIRTIAMRIRAIGILSLDHGRSSSDNDPLVSVSADTRGNVSGDRYAVDGTTNDMTIGEHVPSSVGQYTSVDKIEEEVDCDTLLNGDDDPIRRFLVNRIRLTDDFNQDVVDWSSGMQVDLTRSDRSFFRVLVDCTDSQLHSQMDDIMQSITYSQQNYINQPSSSKVTISLAQCFEKFVSTEKLSARDLWYCRRCKEEKQATKKFDLWSLPKILVIQLKRFRSTLRSRDKIDSLVDFPVKGLDLTPWVVRHSDRRFVYDLIAVSNHMGYLYGGHYTAYALNHPLNCWYLFDDAYTLAIDESQVVTNAAYVLVYRQRDENFRPSFTADQSPSSGSIGSISLTNGLSDTSASNSASLPDVPHASLYINDDDLDNVE